MQILFMAGFLIGMILPDIAWKMEWHQKTISAMMTSIKIMESVNEIRMFSVFFSMYIPPYVNV